METQRRKRHIQQKTISPRTTGSYKLLGLLVFLAGVLFAFLLPSKQNTQPPFMVVELPGKGKGIIATRDIKQGELLIREKPLFTLPKESLSLVFIAGLSLICQLTSNRVSSRPSV